MDLQKTTIHDAAAGDEGEINDSGFGGGGGWYQDDDGDDREKGIGFDYEQGEEEEEEEEEENYFPLPGEEGSSEWVMSLSLSLSEVLPIEPPCASENLDWILSLKIGQKNSIK